MLGVLVLMAGLGIASIVVGNNMLQKKSDQLVALKLDNRLLEEQQIALVQANKDIEKYADLEKIAKSIVPQDKDQAKTVREIVELAAESGVPIASISFPSSNLGQGQPQVVTPTESGTAPATPAAPPITQVKPVDGIPGVFQLEINVQSDNGGPISYANLITFLTKLEQNRRTAQVSQITISPVPKDIRLLTLQLTINVYIKP